MKKFNDFLNESKYAGKYTGTKYAPETLVQFLEDKVSKMVDVTIIVDTSGSMYNYLSAVKKALSIVDEQANTEGTKIELFAASDRFEQIENANDFELNGPSMGLEEILKAAAKVARHADHIFIITDDTYGIENAKSVLKVPYTVIDVLELWEK